MKETQTPEACKHEIINLTPSWGEWGNIFFALITSGADSKSIMPCRNDFAIAMAAAEAFKIIRGSLPQELAIVAENTFKAEMLKQNRTIQF